MGESRLKFLSCNTAEGEDFLRETVTHDENWVHYCTPSMKKKASTVRKTAEELTLYKFTERPSAGKIMATVFWEWYGLWLLTFCL